MSSNVILRVQNVGKRYEIYKAPHHRLLQTLFHGRKQFYKEFWALRDILLEAKKGECIGIIGRNGCGKSTLLQVIAGTIAPTTGSVEVNGKVAALLELGSGFNPEFTGRENAYMNGAILGFSKAEMKKSIDAIATFTDIGEFFDQPVKTYSSGMVVRLAFSVSVSIDPDILIVDEALAVGDIRFQAKCFNRLKKLRELGTTILFVSHSPDQIAKICDKAVLLECGQVVAIGLPKDITNKYMDLLYGRQHSANAGEIAESSSQQDEIIVENLPVDDSGYFSATTEEQYSHTPGWNPAEYHWGNGEAGILDFRILDKAGNHTVELYSDEKYIVAMKVLFKRAAANVIFGFYIKTIEGIYITGANSRDYPDDKQSPWNISRGDNLFEVRFSFQPRLIAGAYMISLGVAEDIAGELVPLDRRYDSVLVNIINRKPCFGLVDLGSRCLVKKITTNPS